MQKWLEGLTDEYLQAAKKLADTDEAGFKRLAVWMKDRFAAHGARELKQQRNLMTDVRAVLRKQFGADHLALETMNFSTEEWIQINSVITQKAAAQNEAQVILSPETVNALVSRATQLLNSRSWADVAAGLAVLTGRRSTEILKTATFTLKTPYSVIFTGALKRKGETSTLSFEIPTLCQAEYVVTALLKLRSALATESMTPQQVNQFADDVCSACNKHFADLVPAPKGRENLYTHLFRKVYATAATYFYCPENVDEAEFRAHIQGHFSGHENLSLAQRRTIASDRHYRSYCIQDDQGNMRKGIRLANQGVEILDVFSKPQDLKDDTAMDTTVVEQSAVRKRLMKRPEIPADLLDQMIHTMASRGVKGSYADVFEALLNSVDRLQVELSAEKQKNQGGFNAVTWFTRQVDELKARIDVLEKENAALKATHAQLENMATLKAENTRLNAELERTQTRLEGIQQLLSPDSATTAAPAAPVPSSITVPTATAPVTAAPARVSAATSARPPVSATTIAPAPAPAPSVVVPISGFSRNPEFIEAQLDADVERALFAVINHNKSVATNADRWVVSVNPMKDLLKQIGKTNQEKIQEVLKAYSHAIEQHHTEFLLGQRHNRVHKDIPISAFISITAIDR